MLLKFISNRASYYTTGSLCMGFYMTIAMQLNKFTTTASFNMFFWKIHIIT